MHRYRDTGTDTHTYVQYLIEKFRWFDLGKEREVYDGHLPGHLLRVKVKDGHQSRQVGRNLHKSPQLQPLIQIQQAFDLL